MRNILVAFQASHKLAESLALAAALGAVQGGANIRLRHLDPSPSAELAHAAYGVLREADLLWAEGLVVSVESATPTTEVDQFTDIMRQLGAQGKLAGKIAWAVGPAEGCEALVHLHSAMRDADMILLDSECQAATPESMNHIGRTMAQK